jgi:enamine deaminase RidA (YjgF/YER057c/UK114 family)
MRDQDELNEVQREFFGEHQPASTTVEVNHLVTPPARLEIEVIAIVPAGPPTHPASRRALQPPRRRRG